MSQQIALPQGFALSNLFAGQVAANTSLTEGLSGGYAVVSIKGKCFKIKHGGNETPLVVEVQGMKYAAPYMDVVLLSANAHFSKTFYRTAYVEGSDQQPDCSSEDGVHPNVAAPISLACGICPMNAFGSRVSDNGGKGKACQDVRKLAIVPASDLKNELYGGPMLLRVPPASLGSLADFARSLNDMGIPYYGVVIRMLFDSTEAFPKLLFQVARALTDAEAAVVKDAREGAQVKNVLGATAATPPAASAPAPAPEPVLQQTVLQQAPPPAPVQQAPLQQAPLQQAPLQQAPLQQAPPPAPVQQAPLQQAPTTHASLPPLPPQYAGPVSVPSTPPPAPAASSVLLSEVDSLLGQ